MIEEVLSLLTPLRLQTICGLSQRNYLDDSGSPNSKIFPTWRLIYSQETGEHYHMWKPNLPMAFRTKWGSKLCWDYGMSNILTAHVYEDILSLILSSIDTNKTSHLLNLKRNDLKRINGIFTGQLNKHLHTLRFKLLWSRRRERISSAFCAQQSKQGAPKENSGFHRKHGQ